MNVSFANRLSGEMECLQGSQMPSPLGLFGKTVLFYLVLVVVMRVMGKRELAKLSPLDLVVTIMIADAAIIAIEQDRLPIWVGLIPVGTIAAMEVGMSYLMLKNMRVRAWVAGKPSVVIAHGRINENELRALRYNLNELLSQLREKNVHRVSDVEFAILEPMGKLSVIPKSDKRPATPADLGVAPPKEDLPVNLVVDGVVDDAILEELGQSREWLDQQLRHQGLDGPHQVLLATYDNQGTLFVQPRGGVHLKKGDPAEQ